MKVHTIKNMKEEKIEKLGKDLKKNLRQLKQILTAEDILTYPFYTKDNVLCTAIYVDQITDKELLGSLIAKPLSLIDAPTTLQDAMKELYFPENNFEEDIQKICTKVLAGNVALFIDNLQGAILLGAKKISSRSIAEPPSPMTIKGPREGFIEDIKTNMGLIRKRLKTPQLQFDMLQCGKQSQTSIAIVYLNGIANKKIVQQVKEKIASFEIDEVVDSSYIGKFLTARPLSLFKQVGTTEKPDIFCAKILEGRIGLIVDGSPIVLTVPYLIVEDFQGPKDYFASPYRATVSRTIRLFALLISLLLPAYYVAAQLFKLQLIPFGLLMTISASTKNIPLSPSIELFFLLVILEILLEASISMPKQVSLALSVIGALVLGDTAVKAGIVSTPAIIIVAITGISAYTVPELVGTSSILRLALLILAGSIGTFGILLGVALILYTLISMESFGTPLLAPFSPLIRRDLKDSILKADLFDLKERPAVFHSKNKRRLLQKKGAKNESN